MITVGNLRRPTRGIRGVNVGRPSVLGNPATHKRIVETRATVQTRTVEEAIAYYRVWLAEQLTTVTPQFLELGFILQIAQRWNIQLLCWCHPGPCHAGVLKEILDDHLEGRSHVLDRLLPAGAVRRSA